MKLLDGLYLLLYAMGMAIGQLMFKAASIELTRSASGTSMLSLLSNVWFLLAAALYAGLTVLWVWILTKVPLVYAYPFVVLSFVFTPLGAVAFFGESLTVNYAIGMTLIMSGLAFLLIRGT